jgi:hypothetical protein
MQGAIDDRSVLREHFAPVGQELWIIVKSFGVAFQAGPDIHVHAIWILAGRQRRSGRAASSLCVYKQWQRGQEREGSQYQHKDLSGK